MFTVRKLGVVCLLNTMLLSAGVTRAQDQVRFTVTADVRGQHPLFGDVLDGEWGYWVAAFSVAWARSYGRDTVANPVEEQETRLAWSGDLPHLTRPEGAGA